MHGSSGAIDRQGEEAAMAGPASFVLDGEAATMALAARLAAVARPGDTVALWGDLGSGKTVFARGFIRASGSGVEDVPSPTFTLVQAYDARGGVTVYHFDLYRLDAPEDAYELGLEDAIAEGITLIEWPERLGRLLPSDRLDVRLELASPPDRRIATLVARGSWIARLAEAGLD